MSAVYDTAVALHVVLVVGGTLGLAVTGGYLAAALGTAAGAGVRRFFSGAPGGAPRLLYPAAALGLVAALTSAGRVDLRSGWVWGAGVLWLVAAALIEAGVRPAERRVGALLAGAAGEPLPPPGGWRDGGAAPALRSAAGWGLAAAVGALAAVLVSSALMVSKP